MNNGGSDIHEVLESGFTSIIRDSVFKLIHEYFAYDLL